MPHEDAAEDGPLVGSADAEQSSTREHDLLGCIQMSSCRRSRCRRGADDGERRAADPVREEDQPDVGGITVSARWERAGTRSESGAMSRRTPGHTTGIGAKARSAVPGDAVDRRRRVHRWLLRTRVVLAVEGHAGPSRSSARPSQWLYPRGPARAYRWGVLDLQPNLAASAGTQLPTRAVARCCARAVGREVRADRVTSTATVEEIAAAPSALSRDGSASIGRDDHSGAPRRRAAERTRGLASPPPRRRGMPPDRSSKSITRCERRGRGAARAYPFGVS